MKRTGLRAVSGNDVASVPKRVKVKKKHWKGLVGFFGHILGPAEDDPSRTIIHSQFQIVRKIDDERYAILFYSYLTGEPGHLGVMPEAELLGNDVKLYPCAELWREVGDEHCKQEWRRMKF